MSIKIMTSFKKLFFFLDVGKVVVISIKVWVMDRQYQYHLLMSEKCKFSSPGLDLPNQELNMWSSEMYILMDSSGDFNANCSLSGTSLYHFHSHSPGQNPLYDPT